MVSANVQDKTMTVIIEKKPCFLDPKEPMVFRYLFAQRAHDHLLMDCLTHLTKRPYPLTTIEVIDPYFRHPTYEKTNNLVSIAGKQRQDDKERRVRIDFWLFRSRIECPLVFPHIDISMMSARIPMIQVYLLNFTGPKGRDDERPVTRSIMVEKDTLVQSSDALEWNFIQLPKFNKAEADCQSVADQWLYFLRHAPELSAIPESVTAKNVRQAYEIVTRANWAEEDLAILDAPIIDEETDA
jgi:hypothetical protein